jgi:hypothetical protein
VPKSYGNPKRSTNASSSFGWSSWIGVGRREIATAQHPFQQFMHLVLPRGGDGRSPNGAMLLFSLRRCGWHELAPGRDDRFAAWWTAMRKRVPKARGTLDSLIIAVTWSIWVQRNDRTFRSASRLAAGLANQNIRFSRKLNFPRFDQNLMLHSKIIEKSNNLQAFIKIGI